MSYFLQRIRLAEISRSITDHNSAAMNDSTRLSYYAHVMVMDVELDQMIHEVPPFFNLDTYENPAGLENGGIFIQAYLLNTIMHTQRCKLHLSHLTSRPNRSSPAYVSSWATCLQSARQINRAEKQLQRSRHRFAVIRRRLSGILYGTFMASVVLLMDACVNGNGLKDDKARRHKAAEALRVVEEARSFSSVAASLYGSLTQVLAKHRADAQQQTEDASHAPPLTNATAIDTLGSGDQTHPNPEGSFSSICGPDSTSAHDINSDQLVQEQDLGQLMDMNGFQWDDMFVGIDSSSLP